jgi:Na+/proline symporter
MLAAMFSATMSSLSGLLNIHASIISKDIFPTLFPRRAGESEKLAVAWTATFAVGVTIMAIALAMALGRYTVFGAMVTFNTVMSLAYGPPALLGLVVRRTPSWSGLASFAVALALGTIGSFVLGWDLRMNVVVVVPASVVVFFLTRLTPESNPERVARREDLFRRLDTPVDVAAELGDTADPTTEVFRSQPVTGLVGLLCLLVHGPRRARSPPATSRSRWRAAALLMVRGHLCPGGGCPPVEARPLAVSLSW